MKTHLMKLFLTSFITIPFLHSCRTNISHDEAAEYYCRVMNLVDKANNESSLYMANEIKIAATEMPNANEIFDSDVVSDKLRGDLRKNRFKQFISYLDSNIEKLDVMVETDKEINLKSKGMEYLKQNKYFYQKCFSPEIDTLIGSKTLKSQMATRSLTYEIMKKDLEKYFNDFISTSKEYYIKYHITSDDLKKYFFHSNSYQNVSL